MMKVQIKWNGKTNHDGDVSLGVPGLLVFFFLVSEFFGYGKPEKVKETRNIVFLFADVKYNIFISRNLER